MNEWARTLQDVGVVMTTVGVGMRLGWEPSEVLTGGIVALIVGTVIRVVFRDR